jgi:hypothetical protein
MALWLRAALQRDWAGPAHVSSFAPAQRIGSRRHQRERHQFVELVALTGEKDLQILQGAAADREPDPVAGNVVASDSQECGRCFGVEREADSQVRSVHASVDTWRRCERDAASAGARPLLLVARCARALAMGSLGERMTRGEHQEPYSGETRSCDRSS